MASSNPYLNIAYLVSFKVTISSHNFLSISTFSSFSFFCLTSSSSSFYINNSLVVYSWAKALASFFIHHLTLMASSTKATSFSSNDFFILFIFVWLTSTCSHMIWAKVRTITRTEDANQTIYTTNDFIKHNKSCAYKYSSFLS